jgi:RecJ-like exonuclease
MSNMCMHCLEEGTWEDEDKCPICDEKGHVSPWQNCEVCDKIYFDNINKILDQIKARYHEEVWKLFTEYREYFGFADSQSINKQCEFEDEFCKLYCQFINICI